MTESDDLAAVADVETSAVVAAQNGDQLAFQEVVERHYRRIYRFLLKHAISAAEAEELTQEVFLRAYRAIGRFRRQSRVDTWLTGIALNVVRNYTSRSPWRMKENALLADDYARPTAAGPASDPHYRACCSAALDAVAAGLGRLPPEMRECLMLVAIEGLSYEEVAALLGEPVGSVKSRVSRARQQLREHIDPRHLEALAGRT
jgi:RNA polymerase sigma factor (sigma-70 family)